MDLSANHLGYVFASYGVSAVVLAILVIAVILRDRRLRRKVEALEKEGRGRRART